MTEEEARDIQYCAEKLEISRTDAIMKGIRMIKAQLEEK